MSDSVVTRPHVKNAEPTSAMCSRTCHTWCQPGVTIFTQNRADRISLGFVLLGMTACCVRYLLRQPMSPDESFLAINLVRRGPDDILGPLEYAQVAPPLFLLAEWTLVRLAGFNELTLRLLPFVCMLISIILFRRLARRTLGSTAYVLAVAIFASSYWFIRYAAEVKPYAGDVLVCLLLLNLVLDWRSSQRRGRVVAGMCALALLSFSVSFPSVFVGGAVCSYMAVLSLRARSLALLGQSGLVGLHLITGFVVVYVFHASRQAESDVLWMQEYWQRAFPPLESPARIFMWLLSSLTGELMPYPIGGKNWGSSATFLLCGIGTIAMFRSRRWGFLMLMAVPLALALIAAALKAYPFGAPTRCQLYLGPIFCLLASAGLAVILASISRRNPKRSIFAALIVLAGVGVSTMARDIIRPTKTTSDLLLRDFARVYWHGGALADETRFCLREDFDVSFTPSRDDKQSLLASFLCNYFIYSQSIELRPKVVIASNTVSVANFRVGSRVQEDLRRPWIDGFEQEYGVSCVETSIIQLPEVDKRDRLKRVHSIELLRFEPVHTGDRMAAEASGLALSTSE